MTTAYKQVKFEPRVYATPPYTYMRDRIGYEEGLQALRKRGYDRYPRPSELFSLIAAGQRYQLRETPLETTFQDAISNTPSDKGGEWLSAAMEFVPAIRKLIVYTDPQGLIWNKNEYTPTNFQFTEREEFEISSALEKATGDEWIDLEHYLRLRGIFVHGW